MKKILSILAALVIVVSSVAAVSAYEAHLINVKAHVENALSVTKKHVDFDTVFPEEWLKEEFTVQTSTSFCAPDQLRVTWVDYAIFAEWKPIVGNEFAWWDPIEQMWMSDTDFYNWMGYFTYVGIDAANKTPQAAGGNLVLVGNPPAGEPGSSAKWVMDAPALIHKVSTGGPMNMSDLITVALDVPVFEGYVNDLTDPEPKPSGLDDPTYVIPAEMPGFNPDGMDFGLDLTIQVTYIGAVPPPVSP